MKNDADQVYEILDSTTTSASEDNNNNTFPSLNQHETTIDSKKTPTIYQLFGGKELLPTWQLRAAFGELVALFGNANSVDWTYANGRKARAIVVPQVKDKETFMKQSVRLQWVLSVRWGRK